MGNPVVHFEIGCRDKEATATFYASLFDWTHEPYGPCSVKLDTGADTGIAGHATALGHEPHKYMMFYVEVDDLEGAVAKAESLGGQVVVPPTPIPGAGRFSWMKDPEEHLFGLIEPA